ncbi:MAG TPA: Ni/Fe hydrogenase subunit alpha [Thermoanaerobaculia bacterium]
MSGSRKTRTIRVDALARVEGEGGVVVRVRGDKVEDVSLRIYEPPRFFEAFLRGRHFTEAPDITARICGICPVAYQMSAIHAMENACGVTVTGPIRDLRRLLYCGEWIESHVLHVAMLHAPDFLGYESAIHMAKDHPGVVTDSLQLKKLGNEIVTVIGGREIHPVNARVGGFHRAPSKTDLRPLAEKLKAGRDLAVSILKLVAGFPFPDFTPDYELVALRHASEYPFNEGRLVSSGGLDIAVSDYESHFAEEHVEHSNALHSALKERGAYFVGPLARYGLNFDRLPPAVQQLAKEAGLPPVCRNPFQSIVVRMVETVYAIDEALRILAAYEPPDRPFVDVPPRDGVGTACTEAPRGILYHRYRIGADGLIQEAKIIPPTSQNLRTIENDLRLFVERNLDLPQDQLTWRCEQAVRNYDPCISCATHFLTLTIERN